MGRIVHVFRVGGEPIADSLLSRLSPVIICGRKRRLPDGFRPIPFSIWSADRKSVPFKCSGAMIAESLA